MGTAPKVYEAIIAVMAAMAKEGIAKSGRNQQQGYAFRGIDAVYAALAGKLSEHKLCVLPRVVGREQVERATKSGGALFYTTLTVEYDLVSSEDGSKHTICTAGEAMDSADKSSNKAMSAAYKYAMIQAFCIPVEGEEDADATTPEPVEPRQGNQKPPAPQDDQPKKAEISKLVGLLMNAAKKGSAQFNTAWNDNAGPVRKAIFADKEQMTKFSEAFSAADEAEGNTRQSQHAA